eukprot:gene2078-9574_t
MAAGMMGAKEDPKKKKKEDEEFGVDVSAPKFAHDMTGFTTARALGAVTVAGV